MKPTTKKPATRRKPRFTAADRLPPPKNGIEHFYASLLSFGITLELTGTEITVNSPHGNVSPALKRAIEQRRAALLPLLRDRQPEVSA